MELRMVSSKISRIWWLVFELDGRKEKFRFLFGWLLEGDVYYWDRILMGMSRVEVGYVGGRWWV